jgi:hypothetical protein
MMIHSDGRYNKNCFFFLSLSISLIPTNKNAPSFFIIIQHHTATKQEEVPLYTQQFSSGSKIDFCLISFVWLYGLSCVFVPHRKRDHRSSSHVCVCVCVCVHMASDGQPKNCIWLCESAREVRRRRRLMASPQLFMHWSGSSSKGQRQPASQPSSSVQQEQQEQHAEVQFRRNLMYHPAIRRAGYGLAGHSSNNTLHIYRWVESVCVIAAPYSCNTGRARCLRVYISGYPILSYSSFARYVRVSCVCPRLHE